MIGVFRPSLLARQSEGSIHAFQGQQTGGIEEPQERFEESPDASSTEEFRPQIRLEIGSLDVLARPLHERGPAGLTSLGTELHGYPIVGRVSGAFRDYIGRGCDSSGRSKADLYTHWIKVILEGRLPARVAW